MAASTLSTSRRSALRGLIAGLAVPMQPHAATADAELLAACADATRCEARRGRINDAGWISDDDTAVAGAEWIDAFERVAELPATTEAGIRAKALALRQAVLEFIAPDGTLEDDGETNHRLALSLCDDILAGISPRLS